MNQIVRKMHKASLRLVARLAATLVLVIWGLQRQLRLGESVAIANIAEGTHQKSISKKADAAITTRFLLVKQGTDADHIALCGASDYPIGVCTDEPAAAEDHAAVNLLAATHETQIMVASEAITAGSEVYAAANGKVQDQPTAAGTYFKVGRALTASSADGDRIEVEAHNPERVVIIAALGNTNNEIGGLTIGASYSQAEVTALRDKAEELADDVRALMTALQDAKVLITAS